MYHKPFLTFEQQIEKIENEYLLGVESKDIALKYISNISYYTLINGYKECLMEHGFYTENMSLNDIFILHHFDVGLQNILFKYSLYVENAFKNKVAYVVANNFGVHETDYLDRRNYNLQYHNKEVDKTIKNLTRVYSDPELLKSPTVYYKRKHNHIPPWILFLNANFNDIIYLYKVMMPNEKKEATDLILPSSDKANEEKIQIIMKSVLNVKYYRNCIAHSYKFITDRPREELPIFVLEYFDEYIINKDDFQKGIGVKDIYSFILSIIILMELNNLRVNFLDELIEHLSIYSNNEISKVIYRKYLEVTSLPLNLIERLQKLKEDIVISLTSEY